VTNAKTLSLLAWLTLVLSTTVASAHPIGLSRGDYRATSQGLETTLTLAERELITSTNDDAGGAELASEVLRRVMVRSAGVPCNGHVRRTEHVPPDGLELDLLFVCESDAPREVELGGLFAALARGHRHEAAFSAGAKTETRLLFEGQSRLDLGVQRGASPEPAESSRATLARAIDFVHMGIEHIWLGFDHLVFLLGLVVVGLEKRRVLGIVTAFTLAHSLTLALSVLGVWSPPGSVVEPLIALSVAYVGIENFVARSFERRTLVAFAFGLVHGFGFAGALGDVGFGGSATSLGLFAFNLGVEFGQLAVLAVLLPLLAMLRRSPALVRGVVPAINAAVVLLGVAWFVLRVA
jgi:hypothetical protein